MKKSNIFDQLKDEEILEFVLDMSKNDN